MEPMRPGALLISVILTAGCYDSREPIGRPGKGAIDARLLGEWTCHPPKPDRTGSSSLWVARFDSTQYFIEWHEGSDVTRYRGYGPAVTGSQLVNIVELTFERAVDHWVFVRYQLKASGRLELSVVDKEALRGFDGKAALREIRRRVDDETLYTPFAACAPKSRNGAANTQR